MYCIISVRYRPYFISYSTFRNSERLFRDSFFRLTLTLWPTCTRWNFGILFSNSQSLIWRSMFVFYPIQCYYYYGPISEFLVQFHILGPITLGPISWFNLIYSWFNYIFYHGPITLVPITCGPICYSWSKFHIPILLSYSMFLFLYFFILHMTLLTVLIHFCSPLYP